MVIYKITNLLNGKIYVGQTQRSFEERISEHKYHGKLYIDREIKKYGWENFKAEIIEECQTVEELNEREIFWIATLNTLKPNGYNLTVGGSGCYEHLHAPDSIQKMSDIAKEIWANRSKEERFLIAKKREDNRKPEEKSATARKRELSKSPEKKAAETLKAVAKRKVNMAAKSLDERRKITENARKASQSRTFEEKSISAKKSADKHDKEKTRLKIKNSWALKTPEEKAEIITKGLATRKTNREKKNQS